jgi:polyphosphate kinase 2 (PPK2 family)
MTMSKDHPETLGKVGAKHAPGTMKRKEFEKELAKLQIELTRLQAWVQTTGARIIVVFEGRDTAGKGGVISRITARTSPRVYRHVALPAPSNREKTQVYPQRYIAHFPAAGEIILFDRSWYNRAGGRARHGLLYRRGVRAFPAGDSRDRAGDCRPKRHIPAQVLSRHQPAGAAAPVRGQDR